MSGSQDEIPPPLPPPPSQTPTQQTPHTISTIKLLILKKGEYDIWAMKMEHYLAHTDYPIWEVIQNGNGHVSITTDTQGQIKVLPPRIAEEILARERERKARTTLLMALPEDHLAEFHKMTDAKEMWEAIKSRFRRNDESKKMQKTKLGVDSLSFDDLYNNLRVFENDVKGSTASSFRTQNVAFVSENTSSTNDVSTAYGVSNPSGQNSQYEHTSSYSLLANQSSCPQLDHEDFEWLDEFDLEEMDLKWQVAMISMRMKKFYKKTGRKLQFDAKEPVGFDKTKVECYSCHKTGHFARECRTKVNQDSRRRDAWNSGNKDGRRSEEEEDYALMAYNSSGSDTEVSSCLKECKESYAKLKKLYDEQRAQLSDASIEIQAYTQGLKKVEAQLVVHQQGQLWYKEKIRDHRYDGILRYENEVLQSVFMNKESDLENQPFYDRFVTAEGMHVVPPPMTGNYMPSGPDIEIDYLQFTYGPKQSQPSEFETQTSEFDTCESNYSEDEHVSLPTEKQETPSFANQQVKPPRETIKNQFTHSKNPKVDKKGLGYGFTTKACFVCGSLTHLIRDCDFHEKSMAKQAELNNRMRKKTSQREIRPIWNNVQRVNHKNQFVPTAVLTRIGKIPVNTARARGTNNVSTARHNFNRHAVATNAAMKDYPHRALQNKGIVDSGCSRHMTGNKAYLAEYQDFNGGPVAFGGSKGYITGKGKIKTRKLDFEDVCFVKELQHFNLFSVSRICDKKNKLLFTDSECLVLSPEFKLPDANQVLLRIPRQNNMYSFNLENIVPSGGLACLIAKAIIDESNKWHIRLGHVNFKNLNKLMKGNLVRGLPSKIFQNDHTCVTCQKGKQHKASCKAKSVSSISQPLQLLHMDLFGPTSVRSLNHKTYCLVIADDFSKFSWVFFLRTKDETSRILKDFIRQIENQLIQKVKTIRSDNGTEFKNRDFIEFCGSKGIKREYSNARTPQQNGVAERKNKTLIEAARTMLADSFLPNTFWAEAVSTACYVLNRVLVTKSHNKTPYELVTSKIPIISYRRPFGCHMTILNTIDHLGKFDGKSEEGFLVGYSLQCKAFKVYNLETKRVEENLHITFLENKPSVAGKGPTWLFDLDYLTDSMNYQPVRSEIQANIHAVKRSTAKDAGEAPNKHPDLKTDEKLVDKEDQVFLDELERLKRQEQDANDAAEALRKDTASPYGGLSFTDLTNPDQDDLEIPTLEEIYDNPTNGIFTNSSYHDEGAMVDFTNLEPVVNVSPIPTSKINSIHPTTLILGDPQSAVQTRSKDCLFACFLSQNEPKKISEALEDESWVDAIQEELLQFKIQKVWILVDLPYGKKAIRTKWVYRNKKDERGVVVRNKVRLVAQGHRQDEGIDYDKVFAPVARIEAIRIFLAFTSYMGFIVYQMDVKSAFLYGKIDEEVYVSQPLGFIDPKYPKKVYKVVKALYGLHQAPRAWYATLSTFLLNNGYRRGTIDKTLFIKKDKHDIILDKYVAKILKKFDFVSVKTTSTPIETQKPLVKDEEASDVNVLGPPKTSYLSAVKRIFRYLKGKPKLGLWYPRVSLFSLEAYSDSDYAGANLDRKSTIGGCQFLGRRLISWQSKKQTNVATFTTEAKYVAASNCRGQNLVYHSKTKHIAIRHHFIRDAYEKKLIQVLKIHTDDNVVDLLTKAFDVSRPSPTTYIPDSILENSGGNQEGQSSSDRSLSGNEGGMTLQIVYDLCISLCTQGRKSAKAKSSVHKDPAFDELANDTLDYMEFEDAQDVRRTRKVVSKEKKTADNGVSTEDAVSTEDVVSTDKVKVSTDRSKVSTDRSRDSTDKEKDSTDRPDEGTDAQAKGKSATPTTPTTTPTTPTTTPTIFRGDETIAQVLLNMSQAKAVSREKDKGVELKDVEETERPRPTLTRSLLTLKPLPKIGPKDKGKNKIEEEDESDTESKDISEAEKKFKQLAHDEEIARKMQEDWEIEEERKRLAEEEATNAALIQDFDDIKARMEADRLLALRLQEEEREQFTVEERAKFLHDTIAAQRRFLAKQRAIAIRNKPPTRTQLRNQMMTYLKHVGNKKHSDLKNKTFKEIQALYEKVKRFDESFTAIGSTKDERKVKEMNKGAKDLKQKRLKKEDTAKIPAKVEVTE
ncbi:putative ribonuclease H-like domain-containing protein [Tanacetum coccineum]|uniref:Ribonuclease H-like domain-containing protein n=1 Tax=Tanacetum coccineum TaxID=301880 RepID=A0ABQ4WGE8_9ASTR